MSADESGDGEALSAEERAQIRKGDMRRKVRELELTDISAALPTVDSDDECDSPLSASRKPGLESSLRTIFGAGGRTVSVLDATECIRTAREQVRTHRPYDEVLCSVKDILGMHHAPPAVVRRLRQLTLGLMGEAEAATEVPPELAVFADHLESLLGTIFTQIADYVDSRDPAAGTPGEDEECGVLGGLLHPCVIQDVCSASKLSLKAYHQHTMPLRARTPGTRKKQSTQPPGCGGRSPRGMACRRLSSMAIPGMGIRLNSVASAFSAALAEGSVMQSPGVAAGPKRRPDTRIDRGSNSPSVGGPQSSPIEISLEIPPSPRAGFGRQVESRLTARGGHLSPHAACISPQGRASPSHSDRNGPSAIAAMRETSRLSRSSVAPIPGLEEKLAKLTTLQFFDIIIETLCVVLCLKFEQQLLQLTFEGEAAGAKRAAEWVAARIVDELYNDGVDPQLPLDQQLILCTEGLAQEEGEYCWRRAAGVDPDVALVVWGQDMPADVSGMTLQRKDPSIVWFEWGTFAQSGLQCGDGSHWTCPRLNPQQYGWRLAAQAVAEGLGLQRVDPEHRFRLPSFLAERPGDSLLDRRAPAIMASPTDADAQQAEMPASVTAGVPGLTLSAPPEGSPHLGGNRRKPHMQPADPGERRILERMYHQRAAARTAAEGACSNGTDQDPWDEFDEPPEGPDDDDATASGSDSVEETAEPPMDQSAVQREGTVPVNVAGGNEAQPAQPKPPKQPRQPSQPPQPKQQPGQQPPQQQEDEGGQDQPPPAASAGAAPEESATRQRQLSNTTAGTTGSKGPGRVRRQAPGSMKGTPPSRAAPPPSAPREDSADSPKADDAAGTSYQALEDAPRKQAAMQQEPSTPKRATGCGPCCLM